MILKKGKIPLEKAKNIQQDYGKYLNKTRKGNRSAEKNSSKY